MDISNFPMVTTCTGSFLAFSLGMVWYHPQALGRSWLKSRRLEGASADPTPTPFVVSFMLWMLASTFFTFLTEMLHIHDPAGLLCLASLLWVAFAMPPTIMGALYTGYPFQAAAIDSAYQLAGYYVIAVVHVVAGFMHYQH